jgi:hypothetical protein
MARLLLKSDETYVQALELRLGVNRFGRSAANDFPLEHSTISGFHCELELTESGLTVKDRNSTNGTFVDGARIQESKLTPGQLLRLGDLEFLVESIDFDIAIPKFEVSRPAPPVVLEDGAMLCPRHPRNRATHQCKHCHEVLCSECVRQLRRRRGKTLELCSLCSHPCERLGGEQRRKKSLLEILQQTVKLPLLRRGGKRR